VVEQQVLLELELELKQLEVLEGSAACLQKQVALILLQAGQQVLVAGQMLQRGQAAVRWWVQVHLCRLGRQC
jgi:hypothetical protein